MSQWSGLAESVRGTAGLPSEATLEHHGFSPDLDVEAIEEGLRKQRVETCIGCGWWFDSIELDADGFCEDDQEIAKTVTKDV